MVLKRVLWLAIFVALFIIFMRVDDVGYSSKQFNNAFISIFDGVVYNVGDNYLKMRADKIFRYTNYDSFENISVEFLSSNNKTYTINALKAISKNNILHFSGNVVCQITNNGTLLSDELFYNQKTREIYSNKAFTAQYITHTLKGSNFRLDYQNNTFVASDAKFVLKIPKSKKPTINTPKAMYE